MEITKEMLTPFPENLPGTSLMWRTLAQAYQFEVETGIYGKLLLTNCGLCRAVQCMTGENAYELMNDWRKQMHDNGKWPIPEGQNGGVWFPYNCEEGSRNRAKIAGLIADELERRKLNNYV